MIVRKMINKSEYFPSLLFTGARRRGDVPAEVFEDLKLNSVFGGVTGVMSGLCGRDDVLRRQELFAELRDGDPALRETLDRLLQCARRICALDEQFRGGRQDGARAVIFAALCAEYCDFCDTASAARAKGFLLSRFFSAVAAQNGGDGFAEFRGEVGRMSGKYPPQMACVLRTDAGFTSADANKPRTGGFLSRINERFGRDGERYASEFCPSDALAERIAELDRDRLRDSLSLLERFGDQYDPSVTECRDELEFICAVLGHEARLEAAGIPLCVPALSDAREITARQAYDFTLLEKGEKHIVPNDVTLDGDHPLYFLSGANGGGKTTYLRAVGINVLLALSGARAAAASFTVGPVDGIFTHFPRDERFDGEGRFANEKRRAENILYSSGRMPLVLCNETFSTTNEAKSALETEGYAAALKRAGAFGIYVTHTPGLSVAGVGSLVCEVDAGDGNRRN